MKGDVGVAAPLLPLPTRLELLRRKLETPTFAFGEEVWLSIRDRSIGFSYYASAKKGFHGGIGMRSSCQANGFIHIVSFFK